MSETIQALLYNFKNLCHDPVAFATVPTFIPDTPITIYLIEVRDGWERQILTYYAKAMIHAHRIAINADLSYIWVQDEATAVDLYVLLQTIDDWWY